MWQRVLLYAGVATALFSAPAFSRADSEFASALTARSSSHDASVMASANGIRRANDGLFYVEVKVGSGKARMVVDTGASHVVLSHADAKKTISHPDPTKRPRMVTAAGTIDADWVIVEQLELEGHVLKHIHAAVPHRDTGLSLLGQSALIQFSSVRIEGDRLSLNR